MEYKIISGHISNCQKWLNQWRHQYKVRVLQMIKGTQVDEVIILLTRDKMED